MHKSNTQSLNNQMIELYNSEELSRKNAESTLLFLKKKVFDGKEAIKRIKNPGMYKNEESKAVRQNSFLASEQLANEKKKEYSGLKNVPEFPKKKRIKTKSK